MDKIEETVISGTVEHIIFANEENGYTVLTVETGDGGEVTVTGCLPFAAVGEMLTLHGSWMRHPSHGQQFKAEYAERTMPHGADAIYEYLSSRTVKGVGPATASVLVTAFGDETLEVIEFFPEKLAGLRGMTLRKATEISESLKRQLTLRRLMEFLNLHGIRPQYAMRLYAMFGGDALDKVRENPYILCVPQVSAEFAEADALALRLGMSADSSHRVDAAIVFELEYNSRSGHVFIPREKLILATATLICVDRELVERELDILLNNDDLHGEKVAGCDACYLPELYLAESETAQRILSMVSMKPEGKVDITEIVADIEAEQGISYAPLQKKTLEIAAQSQIMALTGGPGTGKTTTVRAIIAMLDRMGIEVALAAPTGRAAKRMTELTGREASTIHRLLEAGFGEGGSLVFKRNAENLLKCGAIILDECSMVDITLIHSLLEAMPMSARLILVGDADQLPSVGPGNVLLDILRAFCVPQISLTEIFRQKSQSKIIENAHLINSGQKPDLETNKGDFFFMRRMDPEACVQTVVSLCAERLPKNMGISPEDIQVLTPTRKGPAGTFSLNLALQEALNPPLKERKEKKFGETVFRCGDRVMQIRNDYDIIWSTKDKSKAGTGVYNGDIGYIADIDAAHEMLYVDYDGKIASYSFEMLGELEHAFAMTVHKSQGSEYRAVILCLCSMPPQLMHRGVLYTAVTRARQILIIVGNDENVFAMAENYKQVRRYSGLRARLAQEG